MIKCPNCGSTAQIKLVCEPKITAQGMSLVEEFACGCGTHITIEYRRTAGGYWRHYADKREG